MGPNNLRVSHNSGGSSNNSSDGNGGNAVVDGGVFGVSSSLSSSASPDLELDHNHHRVNPEDSSTPNLHCLLIVSTVPSPTVTEDDVLIMDGVFVDNGPSAPSNARRSISFVNNGLDNRRSASISNLLLVSSGSPGSSGSRRSGFGGQFYQRRDREGPRGAQRQRNRYYEGSWNRWQAGPSNPLQGQQFPLPHNIQQERQLSLPYNMQLPQQYPLHMNMAPPPYFSPWLAGGPQATYTYTPAVMTTQSAAHYSYNPPSGSSGILPVDIRRPDGTPLSLPSPPPSMSPRRPVASLVIRAPQANAGTQVTPPAPETQPSLPLAAPPGPRARPFSWPPTVEEESAIWYALHGTSSTRRRARLPVFRGIYSDSTEGQAPPPAPSCL